MLEVRNLKKIYKTKNGADVNALDGISLQFPETGMVFLLGKSGSGKSTLLNVCGGLDSPTSGEVIVKDRSSRDFSQSDFDSYRNTFVGFIFQEYNILNEFSVEDNIALALELQGKSKDKAAIAALLAEVDLQGYAKRKPNTLSGGQKQRIAIARALVKSPEIIMADEPTGALDSNTGRQVLETLKKLSRDKLVIVVSHDREFAERYGDRIIELKDGKVLSDITKTTIRQQALSDNVNTIGDVLCIKRGKDLTDSDFDRIKAFLTGSGEEVIIAREEGDVRSFKKVNHITDDGEKEVFRATGDTGAGKKQYTEAESRFIRSRLPVRHAVRIGVSSLRSKPVRLIFTILLCTVAFTLFGILSTLNFYDSEATFRQTLADTDLPVMQLQREYRFRITGYRYGSAEYSYDSVALARFTEGDLAELAASINSANSFGAIDAYMSFNVRQNNSQYWVSRISACAFLPEGNALRAGMTGEYPDSSDEIAISSYTADVLFNCQLYDSRGEAVELSSPEDIIGRELTVNGNTFTVTGIVDSGPIPEEYEPLKDAQEYNAIIIYNYNAYLEDGLHLVAFFSPDLLAAMAAESGWYDEDITAYTRVAVALQTGGSYEFPEGSNASYTGAWDLAEDAVVLPVGSGGTSPGHNEAILPSDLFATMVMNVYNDMMQDAAEAGDYDLTQRYSENAMLAAEVYQGGSYAYNSETGRNEYAEFTDAQLRERTQILIAAAAADGISVELGLRLFDDAQQVGIGQTQELRITAVYVARSTTWQSNRIVLSEASFDRLWDIQKASLAYYTERTSEYQEAPGAIYDTIYLPYEYSEAAADLYWGIYSNEGWGEDDSRLRIPGNFVNTLQIVESTVEQLAEIFLYVGLVLAVFAVLLFSNFISVSISQKKREIGILRAVGARSADVFKIFFSESFVIAAVCLLLSTALSIMACDAINTTLASELGASLFVFGFVSFVILVGIAFATAVAATFLPVYNAARKKPVDSIRAL